MSAIFAAGVIFAALLAAKTAKAVNVVGDANAETTISPSNTVIKMTRSGTLTVTEPGEIEILLVGGGGGGGANYVESSKTYYGGGGGAGGVIHKTAFQVTAGEWDVTIGAGGAVGANGGKTTAFGMTAWGGGRGAKGAGIYDALSGASGGGGARYYFNDQNDGRTGYKGAPAKSEYVNDYFNLGNAGSSAANEACLSGHGGGAGGAATWDKPGAAYRCSITGADVAYAGGGGGYAWNVITGVGGGKNSFGGGGNMNDAGGPGVVIVRFTRNVKAEMAFDDATGGTVTTCRVDGMKYQVHTFAQSGQFSIPHHGHVEVLVVGGGGGGGASVTRSGEKSHNNTSVFYGGGGGAGGVIHKTEFFLTNGVYDIVVGAGGAANVGDSLTYVRGGDTRAFGLTAFGGGCGAKGYALTAPRSGASGGGGAQTWWQGESVKSKGAVPEAAYTNAPYFNLGNKGGNAMNDAGTGGGGGGAGGAASGTRGGAAYVCSITGADVAYAGGGGGYYWGDQSVVGGGSGSYGGGNSNGADGGGVVIVRHQLPKRYGTIVFVE